MGYTHYWHQPSAFGHEAWLVLARAAETLIRDFERTHPEHPLYWAIFHEPWNLECCSDSWRTEMDAGRARLSQDAHIALNGDTNDEACEMFCLEATNRTAGPHQIRLTSCCKTLGLPYDVLVVAILTVAARVARHFSVADWSMSSDGDPKTDLIDGMRLANELVLEDDSGQRIRRVGASAWRHYGEEQSSDEGESESDALVKAAVRQEKRPSLEAEESSDVRPE